MPSLELDLDSPPHTGSDPDGQDKMLVGPLGVLSRILLVLFLIWDVLILVELALHARLGDGLFSLSFVPTSMSVSLLAAGSLFNLLIITLVGIPAMALFMLLGKRLWHPLLITISWFIALT